MLINIRGLKQRTTPSDLQEYCNTAGVKLIRLIHSTGYGKSIRELVGFQAVEIYSESVDNTSRKYTYKLEDAGIRKAEFIPEGLTKLLVALVPDTDFNRKVLASVYFAPRQVYKIEDPAVDAEVRVIADEIEAKRPKGKTDKELLAELVKEKQELELKLAAKEKSEELTKEVAETLTGSVTPKKKAGRPKKVKAIA